MESPDNLLSTIDCNAILHNCKNWNNFQVTSHTVKSLSEKIVGFLGQHYFVTLHYTDNDGTSKSQRYFMKVLNGSSKLIFEISKSLNAYNKEEFFYTFLLNEFEKYGIRTFFAPRSYFCKPYLLVLEDLSQRNFVSYRNAPNYLDLEHCKIGLRTLAKFHSSGMLYESAKSNENGAPYILNKIYPHMFQEMLLTDDNNMASLWFKRSVEGIFALIEILPDEYNIKKDEFTKRLGIALESNNDLVTYLDTFKGTVLHGDLWFNNFLFKYEDDVVTDSVLLDYQLLKYGPPSVDVLHFFYANTRKALRDQHFDQLINFYYNELASSFPKHRLNTLLPKDQYLQLCNELQFIIKLQCICDRCVTLLVDDIDLEAMQNDNLLKMYLFDRRSDRITACFNTNAVFREVIGEDVVELYNMLLKS